MVLEKTLESPLDSKEIKPVDLKENQPWIFIGRTATEAEAPILWPSDTKSRLTEKTLILGKTEGRRRRGWQRMKWLDGIIDTIDMNLRKLWEITEDREEPSMLQSMGLQRFRHDLAPEQQQPLEILMEKIQNKTGQNLIVPWGKKDIR